MPFSERPLEMLSRRQAFLIAGLVFLAQSLLLAQQPVSDDPNSLRPKPNFDALSQAPVRPASSASVFSPTISGSKIERDGRLGVPTFLWAAQPGPAAQAQLNNRAGIGAEESAARRFLGENASQFSLNTAEVASATLAGVHNTGRGAVIVRFRQSLGGIEIFREEIKVVMNQGLKLVAVSGYLIGSSALTGGSQTTFSQLPSQALANAASDMLGTTVSPNVFQRIGQIPPYDQFGLAPGSNTSFQLLSSARVKQVLFRLPDHLEAAYYVELNAGVAGSTSSLYYSYVFSALDGRLLFRKNLTVEDSYSYRVWADPATRIPLSGPYGAAANPHPTGLADGTQLPFVLPSLLTLQNYPFSTNDPWLPPNATMTSGNNADAYADLVAPDGFTPNSVDTFAFTTSAGTFDRVYDVLQAPGANSQIQAAVTQLFYNVNFFHDWYYDSGFKEVDGNAQASNYGRGGLDSDPIHAEAYDYSGRNNANMTTPSDGSSPKMQMYLFDGGLAKLSINSPQAIAGDYIVGNASFGPQNFTTSGTFVLVNDGVGAASDGCETPFFNAAAVSGHIAIIDRGVCGFAVKVKNAQLNGATGVLIVNNASGIINMSGTDPTIVIGSLSVSLADGTAIKARAATGVTGALLRPVYIDRNGAIDNQIVGHEWGHYISNRLISDANGLNSNMSNGLGEGWADFHAMLLTVKASDAAAAANANYAGAYALGAYATPAFSLNNNNFYYGIRRYPYSTDMSKDPLTFHNISDLVSLPSASVAPVNAVVAGNGAGNSEVHNTGEIWASMLWECYASLLRDTLGASPRLTFAEAQLRMKDYIIAAYKMTPINPTLLEARDAVIAAAYANDATDGLYFWQAFAKRGAGVAAIAPDRFDPTNSGGVVESFVSNAGVLATAASLQDNVLTCNTDGFLDNGDVGTLNVTLKFDGALALSKPVATVSSTNPAVSFPNGNTVQLTSFAPPSTTAQLAIRVALNGATGIQQLGFNVSISDAVLAVPVTATVTLPGNVRLGTSITTEDSQTPISAYQPVVLFGSLPWQHAQTSLDPSHYRWHGPDENTFADTTLVTPPLVVGSSPFTITLTHRYSFEFLQTSYFDGGVIELSLDNGSSWFDIGAGYDHLLATGGGNILEGQPAYSGISAGWPAFKKQVLNFGTVLSGQTVLVRFRIGTDVFGEAYGWDIENVTFSGVVNPAFKTLIADPGCAAPSLSISKTHSGNFTIGQTRGVYTIQVVNRGSGPTSGPVQVVDSLPPGLTANAILGNGWTCDLPTVSCTRSDVLVGNASFAPITVGVAVSADAPPSVVNVATVSGGSSPSSTAADPTVIAAFSDLLITKTHVGNFAQGQTRSIYTIQVSNVGTGTSRGLVQVFDVLPTGLTATNLTGSGWTCDLTQLSCTRSDALSPNAAYAPIFVGVSVAANAPSSVTNAAYVLNDNDVNFANNVAYDPTNITGSDLQVILNHPGDFSRAQAQGQYNIKVVNWGVGPSSGRVQVTDTLPSGLTATAIVGDGWSCVLSTLTCSRTDSLNPNASFSPIVVTVSIAANAPSSVVNVATVSGGGDVNPGNNSTSDPTNIK